MFKTSFQNITSLIHSFHVVTYLLYNVWDKSNHNLLIKIILHKLYWPKTMEIRHMVCFICNIYCYIFKFYRMLTILLRIWMRLSVQYKILSINKIKTRLLYNLKTDNIIFIAIFYYRMLTILPTYQWSSLSNTRY